tara:strand:+ start:1855 stop:2985 length:1131 start_codon:yes stop_codon:yes gene_type:complete
MSFTKILGSGISTETNLHVGVLTATKFIGDGSELLNVASTSGIGIQSGGSSVGSGITSLNFIGVGNTFALRGDVLDISISSGSDGIVGINTAGISTFNDLNVGGINASGVVTASSFDGNLTGNADTATYATSANTATYATSAGIATNAQGLTGTPNITVGSVTAASGSFSSDVNIGGVLTYEDVTNIDSVGLITARNGINVLAGGVDVTGTLDVSNTATFGADANDVVLYGSSKILRIGASNGNNFQIQETGSSAIISQGTGYLKFSYDTGNDYKWAIFNNAGSVDLYHANNKKFETTNTGVTITGDISATGGTNAIGIQSGGQNISTGVITALNFVGAGNSLSVNGSTVDISISGGGGGGGSSIAASIALSSFLR